MHTGYRSLVSIICLTSIFLSIYGCQIAPVLGEKARQERLTDGIYEGAYSQFPNKAEVKVTIRNNRIENIEITTHFSSWIGSRANDVIPERIVKEQSTKVDAVTGATNSSRVIMNAVQNALGKAYKEH